MGGILNYIHNYLLYLKIHKNLGAESIDSVEDLTIEVNYSKGLIFEYFPSFKLLVLVFTAKVLRLPRFFFFVTFGISFIQFFTLLKLE